MSDAREAAAERRERDEADAAREQRLESLMFANRQAGDPLGEIQRARAAFTDADDECRDLAAKLARAEARRDRASGNITFFAERMQQANQLAQRSASADLLSPAKEALAEAASARVERMLAAPGPGAAQKARFPGPTATSCGLSTACTAPTRVSATRIRICCTPTRS